MRRRWIMCALIGIVSVFGRVEGQDILFNVRVVDVQTSVVLHAATVTGSREKIFDTLFKLAEAVESFDKRATVAGGETVKVVEFKNLRPDTDTDWIGAAAVEMLTTKLTGVPGLVIEQSQVQKVIDEHGFQRTVLMDEETTVKVGKLIGAKRVVIGTYVMVDARPDEVLTTRPKAEDSEREVAKRGPAGISVGGNWKVNLSRSSAPQGMSRSPNIRTSFITFRRPRTRTFSERVRRGIGNRWTRR